jgi:hypothetical protein
MLRSVVPVFLLLVSIGWPAAAMDQSAMEETNCLMACDANQENCGAGQARFRTNRPVAAHREAKASPVPFFAGQPGSQRLMKEHCLVQTRASVSLPGELE